MESDESPQQSDIPDLQQSILDVPGGSQQFESYLKETGNLSYLEFIWACQGMKALVSTDNQRNKQLVTCIYRQFILNGRLSNALSNKTFLNIVQAISQNSESFNTNTITSNYIFGEAEEEIRIHFNSVIYPKYLEYLKLQSNPSNLLFLEDQKKSNHSTELKLRSTIYLNNDELPHFQKSDQILPCNLAGYKDQPPKDCHSFAKELCEKLEVLQLNLEVNRLSKNAPCPECQKEEKIAQESFSIALTKAIEDNLLSSNTIHAADSSIKANMKMEDLTCYDKDVEDVSDSDSDSTQDDQGVSLKDFISQFYSKKFEKIFKHYNNKQEWHLFRKLFRKRHPDITKNTGDFQNILSNRKGPNTNVHFPWSKL